MEAIGVKEIKGMLPYFMQHKTVWSSYDEEADTMYIHFKKPNRADHSEMTDDDIIVRYENGEVVGYTILKCQPVKLAKA